jgi:hypothetical protein
MKSFEQYLEERCFELYPEILDDDMPDFFEGWLEKQDVESLLVYSEGWGRHIKNTILQEVTNLTK